MHHDAPLSGGSTCDIKATYAIENLWYAMVISQEAPRVIVEAGAVLARG